MDKLLSDIYFDTGNPASFGSVSNLYQKAKLYYPSITLDYVKNWLSKQYEYTLYKQSYRNFSRNKIYVNFINELWEIDTLFYISHSRYNNGIKYLINIIDVFSKYLRIIPVKSLKIAEIVPKFEAIFKKMKPKKIRTDQGKEFDNREFRALCQKYNIIYFTTNNQTKKCAVVERVQKTLRLKIEKNMVHRGSYRYIDFLPDIIKSYNHSFHRTIRMKPIDVDESDERMIFKNTYGFKNMLEIIKNQQTERHFEVGDEVRIKFDEKPFDKISTQRWSEKVYKIDKVFNKIDKTLYTVKLNSVPLRKRFYSSELQKVRTTPETRWRIERVIKYRTVNNIREGLVRWLGYDSQYDQWIPVQQIEDMR